MGCVDTSMYKCIQQDKANSMVSKGGCRMSPFTGFLGGDGCQIDA